jgi:hypothetical protein
MLKFAVCNPTKRSKVISALGATKKLQKVWVITFVCRLMPQIYDVTGTTPAGTAANKFQKAFSNTSILVPRTAAMSNLASPDISGLDCKNFFVAIRNFLCFAKVTASSGEPKLFVALALTSIMTMINEVLLRLVATMSSSPSRQCQLRATIS